MDDTVNRTHGRDQQNLESGKNRREFNSRDLFNGHTEVLIEHNGDEYRLRITSNGKLILTK